MELKNIAAQQNAAGIMLILGGLIFFPGGLMYTARAIFKWPAAQSQGFLYWERGLVMAAILSAALGQVLLERLLESAGDSILAPAGMVMYLVAAILVITAETYYVSRQEWLPASITVFIVLAFLGQAVLGASILRTGFLPGWTGWAAIIWSLGWLVILPIARPKDMYYPWLHYVIPVMIGIVLLNRK